MFKSMDSKLVFTSIKDINQFTDSMRDDKPLDILGEKFEVVSVDRRVFGAAFGQQEVIITLRQIFVPKTPQQLMEEEIMAVIEKYKEHFV